jgi:hypothetical protein
METYKTASGETVEVEKYYTVGEPDCVDGCCTPVFVADMDPVEEGPLFFVSTEHKGQLAAELIGCSLEELEFLMLHGEKALKLYKEYKGFKKDGLKSIGVTDV